MMSEKIPPTASKESLWRQAQALDPVSARRDSVEIYCKDESTTQMVMRHVCAIIFGIIVFTAIGGIVIYFAPSSALMVSVPFVILIAFWVFIGLYRLSEERRLKKEAAEDMQII